MPYPIAETELRPVEKPLVERIFADLAKTMGMTNAKIVTINRKSDADFDVRIECTSDLCAFGMWLPLGAIRSLTQWPSREIANMTDHPEMTMEGDWSGVRDTSTDKIWAIFTQHVSKVSL